jgi:hypothetical protein
MDEQGKQNKYYNVEFVDFKFSNEIKSQKSESNWIYHTNPLIDKLFKFTHFKLAGKKESLTSNSKFNPEDLI